MIVHLLGIVAGHMSVVTVCVGLIEVASVRATGQQSQLHASETCDSSAFKATTRLFTQSVKRGALIICLMGMDGRQGSATCC
jgi:hypothetical protein